MKRRAFIIVLSAISFLLNSISYAQIVVDITGKQTMCPAGFKTNTSGNKKICVQTNPDIIAATWVSSHQGCPSGYNKRSYAGRGMWCLKTKDGVNTYNKYNSPRSYLIRAGLSVGPISIGMTRNEVLTILDESKFPSEDREAFSDFVIQYDKNRVSEIMVTSPKYRTEKGISIKTTDRQFLALFPDAKHICNTSSGSKVSSTESIYDAVDKGIAHHRTLVDGDSRYYINDITIHRVGVPVMIFGEIIRCASK